MTALPNGLHRLEPPTAHSGQMSIHGEGLPARWFILMLRKEPNWCTKGKWCDLPAIYTATPKTHCTAIMR